MMEVLASVSIYHLSPFPLFPKHDRLYGTKVSALARGTTPVHVRFVFYRSESLRGKRHCATFRPDLERMQTL